MNQAVVATQIIDVAALRVGMFVHLDMGWMAHPFPLSSFKIVSAEQIATIRQLGVGRVRWNPAFSDAPQPGAAPAGAGRPVLVPAPASSSTAVFTTPATANIAADLHRAALLQQRDRLRLCEQQFAEAALASKQIFDMAEAQPLAAAAQAQALTAAMVDKMLGEGEVCIRVLSHAAGDKASAHAVNVSVISLLMGRAFGLSEVEMRDLGTGALLHDIGKAALPARLRHRDDQFNSAEQRRYEEHVALGVTQARKMGLSDAATLVIAQHHEHADGSGFPQGLNSDRLTLAARIVALVNHYDNLCNPAVASCASTPHEAVALLFARGQSHFDSALLGTFIRLMGVYPPGSAVQLTDSRFALVVGMNSSRPLKPQVLVHEAGVPREEALILDLEHQPGLGVLRSIKPQALPSKSFDYLAPRPRVSYYFDADTAPASKTGTELEPA